MRLPLLLALLQILASCASKSAPEQQPTAAPPPPPPPQAPAPEGAPTADEAARTTGAAPGGGGAKESASTPSAAKPMHRRVGGEVKLGEPKVNGVDAGAARQAIEAKKDDLRKCYEKELLASPSLTGDVDAKVSVEKDGRVKATASGIGNAALEACVTQTFESMDLGRGRGQVTVRITFAPES